MTRRDSTAIDLKLEDGRWAELELEDLSRRAVSQTLRNLGLDPAEFAVSILACNDERIASLNADFRDKSGATNVLSWPSRERAAHSPGSAPDLPDANNPMDAELGDIAISYDTVEREAAASGTSIRHHTLHLIAHSTLHLLGYDHISDLDGKLMEAREVEILADLDVANPYEIDIV